MNGSLQWLCVFRLLLASLCGLLIGIERQSRMKGAGMKTHMMVALGSALMMLVSKYGFFDVLTVSGASVDVSRVAASIAGGIGFLGAGVIFVRRGSVVGLTTAAGLWTTTGVGMAVGSGMYLVGALATALMLFAQVFLRYMERRQSVRITELSVRLTADADTVARLRHWLAAEKITIKELRTEQKNEKEMMLTLIVVLPQRFDKGEILRLQEEVQGVTAAAI